MAISDPRACLREFFGDVPGSSRRQILDRLAIADGTATGTSNSNRRKRAGRARDALIGQRLIVEEERGCCLPTSDWRGLLWSSRWQSRASQADLANSLADPLFAHWEKHAQKSSEPIYLARKRTDQFKAYTAVSKRSEPVTACLHLTAVYLQKLVSIPELTQTWTLEGPLRMTKGSDEIASPAASYGPADSETLIVVPVAPYWTTKAGVRAYIKDVLEFLDARGDDFELHIPRDPKTPWPDLDPESENNEQNG